MRQTYQLILPEYKQTKCVFLFGVILPFTVPVSGVELTEPGTDVITTVENNTVSFVCNASAAHPSPNITWFNDSQTPSDYRNDVEITSIVTELSYSDGYMYTLLSNLTSYPTKYDNGSSIYCNASNIRRQSISSIRMASLYVQCKFLTYILLITYVVSTECTMSFTAHAIIGLAM